MLPPSDLYSLFLQTCSIHKVQILGKHRLYCLPRANASQCSWSHLESWLHAWSQQVMWERFSLAYLGFLIKYKNPVNFSLPQFCTLSENQGNRRVVTILITIWQDNTEAWFKHDVGEAKELIHRTFVALTQNIFFKWGCRSYKAATPTKQPHVLT